MNRLPIAATSTLNDVYRMLLDALEAEQLIDEYFCQAGEELADRRYVDLAEEHRWTACYAVRGTSEGHYIHIDLIKGYEMDGAGQVLHLFTAKTFRGVEHAQTIANRCAWLLGA